MPCRHALQTSGDHMKYLARKRSVTAHTCHCSPYEMFGAVKAELIEDSKSRRHPFRIITSWVLCMLQEGDWLHHTYPAPSRPAKCKMRSGTLQREHVTEGPSVSNVPRVRGPLPHLPAGNDGTQGSRRKPSTEGTKGLLHNNHAPNTQLG